MEGRNRRTTRARVLVSLAAFAALAGVAAAYVALGPDGLQFGSAFADPHAGVLRFRPGDRLVYAVETPEGEVRVEIVVLPPRAVVGPDQLVARGLPMIMRIVGDDENGDGYVSDLAHGGVLLKVDGCYLDPALRCPRGMPLAFVGWEPCPFHSFFTPMDVVSRSALAGGTFTLEDPGKGTRWTYAVERLGRQTVRVHVESVAEERSRCSPGGDVTVDLGRGVVTESVYRGFRARLVERTRGDGAEVVLGGGPVVPHHLVEAKARREKPYPAGAESLGSPSWPLAAAWEDALARSPELAAFMRGPGEAFVSEAANTSIQSGFVNDLVTVSEERWTFSVLRTDRRLLEVDARRTLGAPDALITVTVREASPRPDVPARFDAPSREAASIEDFVRLAGARGWPTARAPQFNVAFDGEDADYVYALPLGEAPRGGGLEMSYLDLNADTGRVESAWVEPALARWLVSPSGE